MCKVCTCMCAINRPSISVLTFLSKTNKQPEHPKQSCDPVTIQLINKHRTLFTSSTTTCHVWYVCMYVRTYVCMYVRMYVCMYVCMVCMVCMYVCTYVCMYVCMYVCTYVCTYACMHPLTQVVFRVLRQLPVSGL